MARLAQLSTGEKISIGAIGGLAAVCVKFLGQDYNILIQQGANLSADQLFAFTIGYAVLTPILVFLGGVLAWVSDEPNRVKLLAIAIAAPAMITTWSGGVKSNDTKVLASFSVISSANADETTKKDNTTAIIDPMKRSAMSWWEAGTKGVKMFFGYDKELKLYYVVAGSFKTQKKANDHALAINLRGKTYHASVGKKDKRDFYPVLLGEAKKLSKANSLKNRINGQRVVHDAYLMTKNYY